MIPYKRGDVIFVYFPFTNFTQVKKRPAIIVQSDTIQTGDPNVIVIAITSNTWRANNYRPLLLKNSPKYAQANFPKDSVAWTDHLMTIEHSLIAKKIGEITDMSEIDDALRLVLAL